ncbi:MAG: hypothetical protein M0R33_05660 [Methylomonas sp.]|uniref:hypothetical protein n=1 Tax=Methylomonas sp. TaxID=418 RepID=UPI0025CDD01B|nr:hypothetical protein [Methylomonas sp.]MCK9605921.1 hypothetical protein [Methylomonas sp.]
MKTYKIKTSQSLSIIAAAMISGFISLNAGATEISSPTNNAELIYQSKAASPSIYSYQNSIAGEVSRKPELIYVSQAYGPAIHSYPHVGNETVVPWNVEYVDTAYGQAIYSYDRHQPKGAVDVLPLVTR